MSVLNGIFTPSFFALRHSLSKSFWAAFHFLTWGESGEYGKSDAGFE